MASPVLIKYIKVTKWKDGMLTVLTRYSTEPEDVPEYLDVASAFDMLGFSREIVDAIDSVEVCYE